MPVLASLVLKPNREAKDPWIVRLAAWIYAPMLRLAMSHRFVVVGLACTTMLMSVMVFRGLGAEFIPRLSKAP